MNSSTFLLQTVLKAPETHGQACHRNSTLLLNTNSLSLPLHVQGGGGSGHVNASVTDIAGHGALLTLSTCVNIALELSL